MPDLDPTLDQRIADLKAEIAALKARNAALEAGSRAGDSASGVATSVEGLDTLILRVAADDRVLYANGAFCRAFGVRREDLVGKDAGALRKVLPVPVLKTLIRPQDASSATRLAQLEDGRVYEVRLNRGSANQLDVVLQDVADRERMKAYVRRYVSADLEDLSEEDQRTFKVPERRFMSVSFTDLRGFTAMSERMTPEEVRTTVNACLEEIIHAIDANRATVDKIVGDEVMALYGAPKHYEDHALRAIRCACDQVAAMRALKASFQRAGRDVPACGIGVNTGEMVLGNMGSSTRQNYTVLGASVNLAARLCGAAAGMEILTTESTMKAALAALPAGWKQIGKQEPPSVLPAELTGKTEAMLPLPEDLAGKVIEIGPEAWAMEIRFRYHALVKVKGVADPLPVIIVEDLREGSKGELTLDDDKVERKTAERIFGRYRLLELAGRGGMGEVWKARDAFGNIVAVKMLISGEGASETQIKRFRREAEVMSRLAHRNICRIHEVGEVDRMQFIAMEYLDGAPLSDVLRHGAESSSGGTKTADGESDLSKVIAGVRDRAKSRPGTTAIPPTEPAVKARVLDRVGWVERSENPTPPDRKPAGGNGEDGMLGYRCAQPNLHPPPALHHPQPLSNRTDRLFALGSGQGRRVDRAGRARGRVHSAGRHAGFRGACARRGALVAPEHEAADGRLVLERRQTGRLAWCKRPGGAGHPGHAPDAPGARGRFGQAAPGLDSLLPDGLRRGQAGSPLPPAGHQDAPGQKPARPQAGRAMPTGEQPSFLLRQRGIRVGVDRTRG